MSEPIVLAGRTEWSKVKPEIEHLFAAQWAEPELPGMETLSSGRLSNWLERNGFAVEHKPGGLPTAFIARAGMKGGPVIGILLEYDALPGLDNDAQPTRQSTGKSAGHACGHNHIGPANGGAAIAALNAAKQLNIKGEIRAIGCPAEELLWGKIALYKAGAFDGLDAILTSHGDYQTGALSRPCQSVVSGEFVFAGEASHGGNPTASNALLCAEMAVNLAKERCARHFPEVFLRHVLRRAGAMPTITPDEARVWFSTRGFDFLETQDAYGAIATAAEEVAGKSGAHVRHQFISETHGYLPNDVLARVLFDALNVVGPPKWSSQDLDYMRDLVAACSPGKQMNLDRTIGYFDQGRDYYGQDDGEISWRIPLGRINWAYPREVPIHNWAWTALSGHKASYPGPLMASEAMSLAALELLRAPELIGSAKAEMASRTKGVAPKEPRIGALKTMTNQPSSFWDATWVE